MMDRSQHVQLCTFRVGHLLCGISLEHIQEITRYQPMTPVPLAPDAVAGLINLRGQMVTVLDLRGRFGLPQRSDIEHSCNLVVRRASGIISLLIDELDHSQPTRCVKNSCSWESSSRRSRPGEYPGHDRG